MWAMAMKEFRQVRRDRRTLALMIVLPLVLLIVFGYAASFDVTEIPTALLGAEEAEGLVRPPLEVERVDPAGGTAEAEDLLRDGEVAVAVVTGPAGTQALIDGSQLFSAQAASEAFARARIPGLDVRVLFNPGMETSAVMVPALAGLILLFIGTVITSLGVVRERQAGTLGQLAGMPLDPPGVFVGKIAPYFLVAGVDLAVILVAGALLFDVPFNGSVATLALGSLLFLFVTLGMGVLISTVSENQGQAIQLAMMTLLPQVL